jgi:[ribosomal protein S5]-alanine N-acetyltransferase
MDLPETTDQTLRLIAIGEDGASKEPLELSDAAREVGKAMCQMYQAQGFAPPWIGYFAQEDGAVVGTCAFKGPPQDGRVEIAYFTFPEHEGRGIATEMARQLVALARRAAPGITVAAQTLPEENASTTVLHKLGFQNTGLLNHPEDGPVWEWRLAGNH